MAHAELSEVTLKKFKPSSDNAPFWAQDRPENIGIYLKGSDDSVILDATGNVEVVFENGDSVEFDLIKYAKKRLKKLSNV